MALKALLIKRTLDLKRAELADHMKRAEGFQTREAELEAAISEVTEPEEQAAVEAEVEKFNGDKSAFEAKKAELEQELERLETALQDEESQQGAEPPAAPEQKERKVGKMHKKRDHAEARRRAFGDMSIPEARAIVESEDVRSFLGDIKASIRAAKSTGEVRAISNIGLTIPTVLLGLLRENELKYSKLTRHITISRVSGEGRVLLTGAIPEAVWTECCANLNELSMVFYGDAFGCWKLGGFFTVCNANLEDSDLDLTAEILSTLGQSLGYTNDKTYLYGTGSNMPLGIVPRLAQTSQPGGYPATARPWTDLHTSNVKTIANTYTGIALFQQLMLAFSAAKGDYSRGEKVWAMNETTYSFLVAQAMSINAAGAIVSGMNGTMPVLGGGVEVLPSSIIPDYNIIAGYFDLYHKVERAGERFASSEHYRFLSDQTVFKGTTRWDGKPVIAEAFVLIGINGTSPTTSATFVGDGANAPASVWLPATATVAAGSTITLTPVLAPYGVKTTYIWASATVAKATVSTAGVVTGVAAGSSVITVTTANGLTAQCTVTVTGA